MPVSIAKKGYKGIKNTDVKFFSLQKWQKTAISTQNTRFFASFHAFSI